MLDVPVRLARAPPPPAPKPPPEKIVSVFVPRLSIRCWTLTAEPLPTATSMITAATPIMMPSIVSADRSLLAAIPRTAMRMLSRLITRSPAHG